MSSFPTNDALEAGIIAQPDEDTPRLAYADWLDEHGDPDRASFIRVQCDLALRTPADPDWFELLDRETELAHLLNPRLPQLRPAAPHHFYFGTYFPQLEPQDQFHRGFPFFIDCQLSEWSYANTQRVADGLAQLVATSTVRAVNWYSIPAPRLRELVNTPGFAALRGLALRFSDTSPWGEDFEVLAWQKLAESPVADQLAVLSIYGAVSARGANTLAMANSLRYIKNLDIEYLNISPGEATKLMAAGWVQGVRQIQTYLRDPEVAEAVSIGLGQLPDLHTLRLPSVTPAAISRLATEPFRRLVRLEVANAGLKLDDFRCLLQASWFSQLRVLNLSRNALGDRAITALAAHPVSHSLRELDLADNPLGRTGLMALTRAEVFPQLVSLSLNRSRHPRKGDESDILDFVSALALPRLRYLSLRGLPVGDRGAEIISKSETFQNLKTLYLFECNIGECGKKALRESSCLRNTCVIGVDD